MSLSVQMAVSMKNVDPAFQGVGQKVYPIDFKNVSCYSGHHHRQKELPSALRFMI